MFCWVGKHRRHEPPFWAKGHESTITMTWRSVICFSLVSSFAACAATAATLSGNVEITNSRDVAVRKHKDYTGVVLWVEPAAQPAPALPAAKRVQDRKSVV